MYRHLRFRNAFHFQEAPNAEGGENPNHCAGNRLDSGLWSREVVSPQLRAACQKGMPRHAGTCIIVLRVRIFGVSLTFRTGCAHVNNNMVRRF